MIDRREFLSGAAAAAALPTFVSATAPKRKILVLGGTSYLGPEIVQAALDGGHEVTLFNRGRTNPGLFPALEKLVGQRRRKEFGGRGAEQDLDALRDRKWDVVIDTSAYYPRNVEDMVALLRDNVGQYVLISTLSVYADLERGGAVIDEDSMLGTLEDKYVDRIDEQTYGPLKAYCELAVEAGFPGRATIVRPGYIIGPGDPFDRLTSRVVRLARGGDTLAPGNPDAELQMIDVRDLGAIIARTAAEGIVGRFNTTGFDAHVSVEEFHHACKLILNHRTTFEWVSDEFLVGEDIVAWSDIACWTPDASRSHTSIDRALASGLVFRPVAETIRDTYEWGTTQRPDRPWRAGLTAEREQELLRKWRAR